MYGRVGEHAFLDYDDSEYVYENPLVLAGLTPEGVAWAFTTGHAANWHPLTWISHMADVSLFGRDAGAHHLVNAAIHGANAILLFLALEALSGAFWPSALVAALFAVHPLNVQSVAWVAERKNVLSTLFWFLGLLAYAAYAKRPSKGRLALVAVLLALGLLSKPMLVTFPLLLLVLDVWPLGRISLDGTPREVLQKAKPLVVEKVPLFALVGISSAVTWAVQARAKATAPTEIYPPVDRVANAFLSYYSYLADAIWPSRLTFFHPHPGASGGRVDLGASLFALVALAGVSWAAWALRRRAPFFLAGWGWYVVTLIPVIGFVQVGAQARADRYTYVPMVGIFLVAAWAAAEFVAMTARPSLRALIAMVAVLVIATLAIRSRAESAYWQDPAVLYHRALDLDASNWLAWNNLGVVDLQRGQPRPALEKIGAALKINPNFSDALYNRGVALQQLVRLPEAIVAYESALRLAPENADAWVNLGNAHAGLGRPQVAVNCYQRALQLRNEDAHALYGLVLALDTLGDRRNAFAALDRLRHVNPQMAADLYQPGPSTPRSR